jgi:hypothetical protein
MTLQETIDAAFLGASNPFREAITYTPTGATAKSIYAQVRRGTPTANRVKGDNTAAVYDTEITISIDSTNGVAVVTIGKDTVTMAAPAYGSAATNVYTVAGIIGKSTTCWKLGLRG